MLNFFISFEAFCLFSKDFIKNADHYVLYHLQMLSAVIETIHWIGSWIDSA